MTQRPHRDEDEIELVCRFLPSGMLRIITVFAEEELHEKENYGFGPDFCECCNALLPEIEKLVTVYRHRRGQHFIFERVPSRVCQRCGKRYFVARVVREMDRLMKEPKPPSSLVSAPLLTLPPSG